MLNLKSSSPFTVPTKKTLLVFAVIFSVLITFIGCENNNGNNNPQCECTVKVHPYGTPCTCPVAGTPACDCSEEEQPQNQTATINLIALDRNYTATVQGYLTDTQWNGVPARIATIIQDTYDAGIPPEQDAIDNVFGIAEMTGVSVTIIVEKTTEYPTYKTLAGNKTTLYVNIDGLDNLQSKLVDAFRALSDGNASTGLCTCAHTYGTTAHLGMDETCTCGGTDCACTEQTDESYNVPIRKGAGVTVQQMNDTVALIKTIMDGSAFANKEKWKINGLTEIHIDSGNTVNFQNGILNIGSASEAVDIYFGLNDIYNIITG